MNKPVSRRQLSSGLKRKSFFVLENLSKSLFCSKSENSEHLPFNVEQM